MSVFPGARLLRMVCAGAAFAAAPALHAQMPAEAAFPQRQVRVVVPFPAGGTTDTLARIVAEQLAARWRQAVVVENQPGANGIVAAEAMARAPADGYTLFAAPLGPIAINALLYRGLNYAPRDFAPLTILGTLPSVLALRPTLAIATAGELVALARAHPAGLTYASQGVGSTSHLTAAMFEAAAGLRLRHIPYNGSRPALADLAGGQVDLFFDNISSPLPLYRAGRLKIVAVASLKRVPQIPELPTLDESGLPGFESSTGNLLAAPAGVPRATAARIAAAAGAALHAPGMRERLLNLGVDTYGGTPEQAARYVAEQSRRWKQVIDGAGIRID